MRDVALAADFHSVLIVPLLDLQGTLGALVILRKQRATSRPTSSA